MLLLWDKWTSAPFMDFPHNTQYVLYRSGNLQTPDWPQMRHSLMTPSPSPQSPHVSFPPTAFQPVKSHDPQMTNPLNHSTPMQLVLDQHPQHIATFIPNTSHFQSTITPRKLWPQCHPSQYQNYQLDTIQIPLYDFSYPYQNVPGHIFVPQDTTQPKTLIIPPTHVIKTSNAMTQTTDPTCPLTRPH